MRDRELIASLALWALFLATSVYGHVALKVAADRGQGSALGRVWSGARTVWGITAIASWTVSGVLWMMVLAKTELARANSISSVRYVLICLAAAYFLGETLTSRDAAGVALIALGLVLIGKG